MGRWIDRLYCWIGIHDWRYGMRDRECRNCGKHQQIAYDYTGEWFWSDD